MSKSEIANEFLSDLVVHSKYANIVPEEHRKQTWEECVAELEKMFIGDYPHLEGEIRENMKMVYAKKVFPSMRSIQFGGLPISYNPTRIYNCSALLLNNTKCFSEIMHILLSGTGIGVSIQKRHIDNLPIVKKPSKKKRFLISDSIEGWADAVRMLCYSYLRGNPYPEFDYRDIRPKGSIIKKLNCYAPGHERLKKSIEQIDKVFKTAIGRKLTPLECLDISCFIGDAVVSGGVRMAAMIMFFDKDDEAIMTAKSNVPLRSATVESEDDKNWYIRVEPKNIDDFYGDESRVLSVRKKFGDFDNSWDFDNICKNLSASWYYVHPQRAMSNNSAVLHRDTTTREELEKLMRIADANKSGEPGLFWTNDYDMISNPCGEIALNDCQFCNLSTIVAYDITTQEEFNHRARVASFLGTLQAGYTDFHYLRPKWKEQTEKEALLGVSLTGIASGTILSLNETEAALCAVEENKRVAKLIGVNEAQRVTTIKPEGTSTIVAGVFGSGIHSAHAEYYVRNIRILKSDPVYTYLKINAPDFLDDEYSDKDKAVFSVPMRANHDCIFRTESTFDLLERIKRFNENWIAPGHISGANKHNVSSTVYVKDGEIDKVIEWMWDNRNSYSGLTILPFDGGTYKQAPFQDITKEEYEEMLEKFPTDLDLSKVYIEDIKTTQFEYACAGGACEVKSV